LRIVTQGSDVRSAWSGRVVKVVNPSGDALNRGYGRYVDIDHGNGYGTRYAHFDRILVKEGQEIKLHMVIGKAGNTGDSTGAHLHFEVRRTTAQGLGELVDPSPLLQPALPGRETLRGISLAVTQGGVPVRYDVSAIHADDRQALAEDIARMLKEAFGKPPKKDQAKPAPAPEKPAPAPAGERETFGPFQFTLPAGWTVVSRRDDGIQLGTKGGQSAAQYVNLLRHPGFPNVQRTPEGIGRSIVKFSWQQASTESTTVGPDKMAGFRMRHARSELEAVLFAHGGQVYMLSRNGSGTVDTFRAVQQSIALMRKDAP
jgi:hypothetical protein